MEREGGEGVSEVFKMLTDDNNQDGATPPKKERTTSKLTNNFAANSAHLNFVQRSLPGPLPAPGPSPMRCSFDLKAARPPPCLGMFGILGAVE